MFEIFIPYTGVHLTYKLLYISFETYTISFWDQHTFAPNLHGGVSGPEKGGGGNDPMPLKIDGPDTIATVSKLYKGKIAHSDLRSSVSNLVVV